VGLGLNPPIDTRVAVNLTRLRVRIEGRDGAPWLVLAHSIGTGLKIWDDQVAAFGDRYRILRYDMRRHGQSDAPPGPYTTDQLADDFYALLAHFGIPRAHLVGVSIGGLTAIAVALRHESAVASIFVSNSRTAVPPDYARSIAARNRLIRAQGMDAIVQPMVEVSLSAATIAARPGVAERLGDIIRAVAVEGFAASAEAVGNNRLGEQLSKIRVPSLFIAAEADPAFPPSAVRDEQLRVPGSEFLQLSGGGHLSNLNQPVEFNAAVLDFLGRVATAGR
jgi:3-oxoadipate enol-lactonase